MMKRYYRLESPTLRGLVPLDKVGTVSEASGLQNEAGEFHSYGFSFELDGGNQPLIAGGFVDRADAESERQRLLCGMDALDSVPPRPFDDISLRTALRAAIGPALDATELDHKPRYIVAHGDETFTVQEDAVEEVDRWYMLIQPDLTLSIQKRIPEEVAAEIFASGAFREVDPHRREIRIEP